MRLPEVRASRFRLADLADLTDLTDLTCLQGFTGPSGGQRRCHRWCCDALGHGLQDLTDGPTQRSIGSRWPHEGPSGLSYANLCC